MKRLILLFGGTCVGKSTLESKIVEKFGVKRLELHTTRTPRTCDTLNYCFHADWNSFMKSARESPLDFFYHTEINNSYYGYVLPKEDGVYITTFLQEEYAATLEAIAIKQGYTVEVNIITCTSEESMKCYRDRGMGKEEVRRRMGLNKRASQNIFAGETRQWTRHVTPSEIYGKSI